MRFIYLVIFSMAYLAYVTSDACVKCNSANDPKCATDPEKFFAKECTNATSKCYTRVLNGNTIRGCANELDNATASRCGNEMECIVCSYIEGCNRQIFPSHRMTCLQCQGNLTGSCANDSFARATICPIYKLGDKCYIRNNGKNKTTSFERGCLSSAHARKVCVDERNCFTCDGPGCNFLAPDNNQIPTARDSAILMQFSTSLLLLLLALSFSQMI